MTGGALKLIALFLMTIDHIGEFFPDSPIWFRYLGRLSAPIFFFTAVEGICYTHNRITYLKRLYIASVLMSISELVFSCFSGVFITNNIFASILHGTTLVYILEEYCNNRSKRNKLLAMYFIWQIISTLICVVINSSDIPLGYSCTKIIFTVLGNYLFSAEGAFYLTFSIVIFYFCRNNKKKLIVFFTAYCLLFFSFTVLKIPTYIYEFMCHSGFSSEIAGIVTLPFDLLGFEISANIASASFIELAFEKYYQWMMIFSLPIILLYNGKRGKYPKMIFYIYYPTHIFILAALSIIIA